MKRFIIAISLLGINSFGASAADLGVRPYPSAYIGAPIVTPWSGFYLGGQGGYAGSRSSVLIDNTEVNERFHFESGSGIGGGHAGVQWQFQTWVLGVEGTYSATRLNKTETSVLLPNRLRTVGIHDVATVVGKAGFASGNWMLYVKGGWADAQIETFGINTANGVNIDLRKWQSGYTVGGGIDYMVGPGWIVGIDFNYYNFGFDRSGIASDGRPGIFSDAHSDIYSSTLRLSYLFNWSKAARY